MCKIDVEPKFLLNRFLKSLLLKISTDVTMTFMQTEDEAILKAQTFELIYAQSGYLYMIMGHVSCSTTKSPPCKSHTIDGLIGYLNNQCSQPTSSK